MAEYLTDEQIDRLIHEQKPIGGEIRAKLKMKAKRGHYEARLELQGADGGDFAVMLRQGIANQLNFSVILAYRPPGSGEWFRLRRYNGYGHTHRNRLEAARFVGPHIHQATERYQQRGEKEDAFAEPTDRYSTLDEALECLLADCAFVAPPPPGQTTLSWN